MNDLTWTDYYNNSYHLETENRDSVGTKVPPLTINDKIADLDGRLKELLNMSIALEERICGLEPSPSLSNECTAEPKPNTFNVRVSDMVRTAEDIACRLDHILSVWG